MRDIMRRYTVAAMVLTAALLCLFVGLAIFAMREDPQRSLTPLLEDLPRDAQLITHIHEAPEEGHGEEPRGEIIHYATPEAARAGGPIHGVYGYRIVSIEYEIPTAGIRPQPVGGDDPGSSLAAQLMGLEKTIVYDHFHIGVSESDFGGGVMQPVYRIHFMLIPHEEELKLGLSCS